MTLADDQEKARINKLVLTPLAAMDEVLGQEYAKGEVAGIKLFVAMIPTLMNELQTEIEERIAQGEDNANS